jgi:hypothetical protein
VAPWKSTLQPPQYKSDNAPAADPLKAGLLLKRPDQEPVAIETLGNDWAEKAGIKPGENFILEGWVRIDSPALTQFQAEFGGRVKIDVQGVTILDEVQPGVGWKYAAVELQPLWQPIKIQAVLNNDKRFNLHYGAVGTKAYSGESFRHE